MHKWIFLFLLGQGGWLASKSQVKVDPKYISDFELPYVARLSIERTGAGLEISPDKTLIPPSASFPFNTGINLGINLSYKFLNLSISQSLQSRTDNRSFVVSLNTYNGVHNYGGKLGFYHNVAALKDQKNLNVRSSINLLKLSPYWLIHPNFKRLSLAAIADFSQIQRSSAGAFMFELNPFLIRARGRNGPIIPSDDKYKMLFEEISGLNKLIIINLDFRPGYVYTKVFDEGAYFLSGGLFLGPGFGYHHAKGNLSTQRGIHWQTSMRMLGSLGYNNNRYFIAGSIRYTNSFTPVSTIGVLAEEGSFMLTFGLRFNALEDKLPDTWEELIR